MKKLRIETRYPILVGDTDLLNIVLVGCGGTGSYLALHLARLVYTARARGRAIHVTFIDPDTVGPENVGRQNFAPAEIGQPKAWALMERYNRAFGLRNAALVEPFQAIPWPTGLGLRSSVSVVIGCVDNYQARAAIHEAVCDANRGSQRVWWLDCLRFVLPKPTA
jgi:PRTRC genetic system ThiF family protein